MAWVRSWWFITVIFFGTLAGSAVLILASNFGFAVPEGLARAALFAPVVACVLMHVVGHHHGHHGHASGPGGAASVRSVNSK